MGDYSIARPQQRDRARSLDMFIPADISDHRGRRSFSLDMPRADVGGFRSLHAADLVSIRFFERGYGYVGFW